MANLSNILKESNRRRAKKRAHEIRLAQMNGGTSGGKSKWQYEFQTVDGVKSPVARFQGDDYQPFEAGVSDEQIHEQIGMDIKKGTWGRSDKPLYERGTPAYQGRFDELRGQQPSRGSFAQSGVGQTAPQQAIPSQESVYGGQDASGEWRYGKSSKDLAQKISYFDDYNTPEQKAMRAKREATPYFKSSTGDIRGWQDGGATILEGPGSVSEYKKHMGWESDSPSAGGSIDDFIGSAVDDITKSTQPAPSTEPTTIGQRVLSAESGDDVSRSTITAGDIYKKGKSVVEGVSSAVGAVGRGFKDAYGTTTNY